MSSSNPAIESSENPSPDFDVSAHYNYRQVNQFVT